MKIKYIVVGAGGTGSYLVNSLVNYLNYGDKVDKEIVIVDGDFVEERNLLRQGFLQPDIGRNKAKVLSERFEKVAYNVGVSYRSEYIEKIEELTDIIGEEEEIEEVVLISCVDNNMARLRILVSQYAWYYTNNKTITFIDGGNSEWTGQTIVNRIVKGEVSPVIFDGIPKVNEESEHKMESIFNQYEDWKSSLTQGDFELSCDVIVENAPQNVLANMMSSMGIMKRVYDKKDNRFQFDVSNGVTEELGTSNEKGEDRLREIIDYINTDGKDFI